MYSGEQSKKWIEDNKDNLIEVFLDLFSKKTGKSDSSKQNHQLKECIKDKKECIKDKKESLKKVFLDLFSKKEGKGDGEGKLILVCFGIKTLLAQITKFCDKCIQGNKVNSVFLISSLLGLISYIYG